jgi:hypothetical protein
MFKTVIVTAPRFGAWTGRVRSVVESFVRLEVSQTQIRSPDKQPQLFAIDEPTWLVCLNYSRWVGPLDMLSVQYA